MLASLLPTLTAGDKVRYGGFCLYSQRLRQVGLLALFPYFRELKESLLHSHLLHSHNLCYTAYIDYIHDTL